MKGTVLLLLLLTLAASAVAEDKKPPLAMEIVAGHQTTAFHSVAKVTYQRKYVHSGGLIEPAQHPIFRRPSLFTVEVVSYAVMNTLDGISTNRTIVRGFHEAPFPDGSAYLLGKYPSSTRYAVTFGAIEVVTTVAAYRLQHSKHRSLRLLGHGLMIERIYEHASGFSNNAILLANPPKNTVPPFTAAR